MPQAAALVRDERTGRYSIGAFLADITDIETTTDPGDLKRKSRDYYWYSPILNETLKDKVADVVVTPKDEGEVVRVAATCAKHRIPLTVRAGVTGKRRGSARRRAVLDSVEGGPLFAAPFATGEEGP